jgi:hypothetical protein
MKTSDFQKIRPVDANSTTRTILMPTTVVNKRHDDYDENICRPSKWGNPFIINRDGDRWQVIEKYRQWILTQPHLIAGLRELKGKRLGCVCFPLACHGDVLAAMADALSD